MMGRAAVFLLGVLLLVSAAELAYAAHPTDFIRASCRTTTYPELCLQCLSAYAPVVRHSPRHLANAALSVSASRALAASTYVKRLSAATRSVRSREAGAVQDCLEMMRDSVDRLRQSVKELARMGRAGSPRFGWHFSNVQTWVSAALTDENTCLDSLAGDRSAGGLRAAIRPKVLDVAKVTSNALALITRIGPRN